jgi:anti-anti-sigma factor
VGLTWEVDVEREPVRLIVSGEIDAAHAPELARAIAPLLTDRLVIDLKQVTACDAAGTRLLATARERAEEIGVRLELRGASFPIPESQHHVEVRLPEAGDDELPADVSGGRRRLGRRRS